LKQLFECPFLLDHAHYVDSLINLFGASFDQSELEFFFFRSAKREAGAEGRCELEFLEV
jgi:hypothetical protein